jgi:CBS domain-containing protein
MTGRTVGEIMTRIAVCIDADATVDEAVALMDIHHVAQVPVTCGTSIVGLVSRTELLAAFIRAVSEDQI